MCYLLGATLAVGITLGIRTEGTIRVGGLAAPLPLSSTAPIPGGPICITMATRGAINILFLLCSLLFHFFIFQ